MFVRSLLTAVIIGFASSAALAAAASHKPGDEVRFCGTVAALTEAGCIGVNSGGEKYDITGASPKPAVGKMIAGSGKVSGDPNICQEGVRLSSVTWKETEVCTMGGQ